MRIGLIYFQLNETPADVQSLKTLDVQVVPVYTYLPQSEPTPPSHLLSVFVCEMGNKISRHRPVVWTYKWCNALIVFDRERADRLYSAPAWLAAELIAWLPVNVGAPVLYAILVYFLSDLRHDDLGQHFGVLAAVLILVQFVAVAWALFAASVEVSLFSSERVVMKY
jgi:hypothetical protein